MRNRFARHLANAIGAKLDAFECLIDFVKCVLLLREQAERKITIVSVRTGIGLMHAKSGSLVAFCPRTQRILGDTGHGINHGIAKLQQFLLLRPRERIKSALLVVRSQNCWLSFPPAARSRLLPSGFRSSRFRLPFFRDGPSLLRRLGRFWRARLFRGLARRNFFVGFGHKSNLAPRGPARAERIIKNNSPEAQGEIS